jgi:hypothetical protein
LGIVGGKKVGSLASGWSTRVVEGREWTRDRDERKEAGLVGSRFDRSRERRPSLLLRRKRMGQRIAAERAGSASTTVAVDADKASASTRTSPSDGDAHVRQRALLRNCSHSSPHEDREAVSLLPLPSSRCCRLSWNGRVVDEREGRGRSYFVESCTALASRRAGRERASKGKGCRRFEEGSCCKGQVCAIGEEDLAAGSIAGGLDKACGRAWACGIGWEG